MINSNFGHLEEIDQDFELGDIGLLENWDVIAVIERPELNDPEFSQGTRLLEIVFGQPAEKNERDIDSFVGNTGAKVTYLVSHEEIYATLHGVKQPHPISEWTQALGYLLYQDQNSYEVREINGNEVYYYTGDPFACFWISADGRIVYYFFSEPGVSQEEIDQALQLIVR